MCSKLAENSMWVWKDKGKSIVIGQASQTFLRSVELGAKIEEPTCPDFWTMALVFMGRDFRIRTWSWSSRIPRQVGSRAILPWPISLSISKINVVFTFLLQPQSPPLHCPVLRSFLDLPRPYHSISIVGKTPGCPHCHTTDRSSWRTDAGSSPTMYVGLRGFATRYPYYVRKWVDWPASDPCHGLRVSVGTWASIHDGLGL